MRNLRLIGLVLGTVGLGAMALSPIAASAQGPGYLTVQFGRSIEGSYAGTGCTPAPGFLTLAQDAANLATYGMTATTTVVVDRTGTAVEDCMNGDIYADWSDLQALQADGWQIVSDGMTHNDMTLMAPTQQLAESCGSLPYFTAEGISGANAEFAYGDNHFTNAIQTSVVATCFTYGRTYRGGVMNEATMNPLGYMNANSITGGDCNEVGLPCSAIRANGGKRYMSPAALAAMVAGETAGQWIDLQFYRIVSGVGSYGPYSWDCTGATWQQHWTSQTEMYCQNDMDSILAAVPAGIQSTGPATVATAWGQA